MRHTADRYRELKLFLVLALAGVVAALNHVHIPHTEVLIDGRWAFGFMGFALLHRWWAALALAALLSYPYGTPDIPLWIGFGGNMLLAVPALLTLRPLSRWMLRRWGTGWRYGLGWLALVLLCYQAFTTPVVWGVSALLEERSALAGILEGWRAQPFLVESILVALFSAAALMAALAVEQLRDQRRRLEHINRVLLGIRNVNQLIVKEDDPRRLIETACVNLTETMGYHNAWIALLGGAPARGLGLPETGPVAATAAVGFDGGFARLRARLDQGVFPDCMSRALKAGDTLVVDNPAADCADCPVHSAYGGRAGLVRRLDFDGVTYGILTASVPGDYAYDTEEQDLFNEVAGDLAFALHKIVTARRLAESRQHLSFVIEGSGIGTWAWHIQTNATVFNDRWAAMLGYTLEELTPYDYTTWERLVHPADLERARAALTECVAGGTADYSCEFRMKHKDGRWVWILDRGRVMTRDEEGKPLAMFGTHTDITEMKQAEASLKRERAMLARTEAVAHVGSWEWEVAGDKVTWSEELFRIFGLEPAEQAPPFAEHQAFYVPEDRARLLQAVEDCLRNGVPYDLDVRMTRSDGQVRHCVARGMPEREADGVVRRLYGSLQDITEIKRAEGRIALLGRMLDDAPASITIHDTDGRFVFANAETVALHGYDSLDEFLQVNLHALDVPESEVLLAERFRKIAEEGEARFEVKHYRKDGSAFPLEILAKRIKWEGRPAILSIATDITERKRAEKALADRQALLTAIYRNAPLVMMVVDSERRVQQINGFATQFAGRPAEEMLGLRGGEALRCFHALDDPQGCGFGEFCRRCVIRNTVLHTLETGETHLQVEAPYAFQSAGGEAREITLLCSTTPLSIGEKSLVLVTLLDITARVQAERALQDSEKRYRRLFEAAHDGILILDAETGKVVNVNPFLTRLLGYSYQEFVGKSVWEIGPFKDITSSREAFQILQKDEAIRYDHLPLETADGRLVDVEFVSNVYLVDSVKVIQCNIRDITERKQAEMRIEHLNRVLRAIRDVNQLITHEKDRDILLQRACEILISTRGYRSAWVALRGEDGAAQTMAESGLGADFAPLRQALARGDWPACYRQAQAQPDGIAPIHNTNRNCTACSLAHVCRDTAALAGALRHGGRDYGALVVALPEGLADDPEEQSLFRELVSDVAYALHSIELAEKRAQAEEEIKQSEKRLMEAQHIARMGDFTWAVETGDVTWSDALFDLLGYDKSEDIDYERVNKEIHHPDDLERVTRWLNACIASGTNKLTPNEYRIIRRDGEVIHVRTVGVIDRSGASPTVFATIQDITERKRAEEALLESEQRFQRMLEVVPDMISIHSPEMDILYSNWQGFAAVPEDNRILNTKCYRTYRGLDKICPDCRAGSVLETRKALQEEVLLPDGTWVDLRVIPLLDQDNNVEMFMEWVRVLNDN
ncbi:MAG: PAS domain S-box protein [Anaerolineae bacterium]|nr:PAS domain S-box protein [Anaerolineae bacterium]